MAGEGTAAAAARGERPASIARMGPRVGSGGGREQKTTRRESWSALAGAPA